MGSAIFIKIMKRNVIVGPHPEDNLETLKKFLINNYNVTEVVVDVTYDKWRKERYLIISAENHYNGTSIDEVIFNAHIDAIRYTADELGSIDGFADYVASIRGSLEYPTISKN